MPTAVGPWREYGGGNKVAVVIGTLCNREMAGNARPFIGVYTGHDYGERKVVQLHGSEHHAAIEPAQLIGRPLECCPIVTYPIEMDRCPVVGFTVHQFRQTGCEEGVE